MSNPPMSPDQAQRHKRTATLSAVLAIFTSIIGICGVIFPLAWRYALAPALVSAVSLEVQAQVAEKLGDTVDEKVAPLVVGFRLMLMQQIAELERDVDRLEFERRAEPSSWTLDKVNELRDKTNRLKANRDALAAIDRASQ